MGIKESLDQIQSSIQSSADALDNLNSKMLSVEGSLTFRDLIDSAEKTKKTITDITGAVGSLGSNLTLGLDFDFLKSVGKNLGSTFDQIVGSGLEVVKVLDATAAAMDSITGFSRDLNKTLFESVSKFNGSFEAAKEFGDYIISSAQEFTSAEGGFIRLAERIAAVKGLAQAGVPLERMKDTITSATGEMNLLNTSILHSESLGMELSQYLGILGESMVRGGLDTQEAAEQMALFGDISERTGIRTDKVAGSLTELSNSFSKLGVTAAFGEPILEGFAGTLSDMGLGFENALDLSKQLSQSLINLSGNYAAAYVTFQRGGLDIGGGDGALGAGIGLRARLAENNPEDQGQLALEMAGALRDTLESFGGGQVVTVQEAAMDPALQATFYAQTKLLGDLYGIQDPGAQDRTLELLTQLEDATRNGDRDLAESLGTDLQNAMQGRDETLSAQEKIAIATEGSFIQLKELNKNLIEGVRLSGDSLAELISDFQKEGLDMARPKLEELNLGDPKDLTLDFRQGLDQLSGTLNEKFTDISQRINSLDPSALIDYLKSDGIKTFNPTGDIAIENLTSMMSELVTKLGKYLDKRESGPLLD